jgi:hypothetical protein
MTTPKAATTWLNRIAAGSTALQCKTDWNDMAGSDAQRFCNRCQKSVMNLSEMTAAEAETRLWDIYQTSGEVPCVTFVLDEDDRMIVKREARRPSRVSHPARLLALGIAASLPLAGCARRTTGAPPLPTETSMSASEHRGRDETASASCNAHGHPVGDPANGAVAPPPPTMPMGAPPPPTGLFPPEGGAKVE